MTIYAITGDSGTGKSSLVGSYLTSRGIKKLVTITTRPPKPHEINGKHYYFRTEEEFDKHSYIESSEYAGYRYGSSEEVLNKMLDSTPNMYVILDKSGIRAFKKKYGNMVVTIKLVSGLVTMVERLKERGETANEIKKRVEQWHKDREYVDLFIYDYIIDSDTTVVTEITNNIDRILEYTMV